LFCFVDAEEESSNFHLLNCCSLSIM